MNVFSRSEWIWIKDNGADTYAEFLLEFEYKKNSSVKLRIAADSDYAIYDGDGLIAFGQYHDYPHYKVYDTIDLTRNVRQGHNVLKVLVWYYGIDYASTYCKDSPGVIFEVECDGDLLQTSGKETLCRKNVNYRNGYLKKITSQLGLSFQYDASRDNILKFFPAKINSDKGRNFYPRPVKKLELLPREPSKLLKTGDGYLLLDLGREVCGFLDLELECFDDSCEILIAYGEHITDGGVRRKIGERDFSVEYKAKKGKNTYLNPFRRISGRYLELRFNGKIEIGYIGIRPVMYPVEIKPFELKDCLSQQIYDVSLWTLRLCMHEHYEDCPWREQALYTLDSRNQMLCGYYAFQGFEFQRGNLLLICRDKSTDGLLSICFPCDANLTIPSFSLYFLVQMSEYAEYSGDYSLIEEYREKLFKIVDVFASKLEGEVIDNFYGSSRYWNFYEWQPGLEGQIGEAEQKRKDLILNAVLSYALQKIAPCFKRIGEVEKSEFCERFSLMLNVGINRTFYDSKKGLYKSFEDGEHFSVLANSMAILCGSAEPTCARQICEKLTEASSDLVPASLSMIGFFYDALLKVDQGKYRNYILDDILAKYKIMLDAGATTFWETCAGEADFGGAGSLCHGWSAMPVYYFHLFSEY